MVTRKKKARKKPAEKSPAVLRLEKTGRICDGCGDKIGRWTRKCAYDTRVDNVYCSTGGCAEELRQSPVCDNCSHKINPFTDKATKILTWPQETNYCGGCSAKLEDEGERLLRELEEEAEEAEARNQRARKKQYYVPKFEAVREIPDTVTLTEEQEHAVASGPYYVVRIGSRQYNVVRPLYFGDSFIRSAGLPIQAAFEKCAQFNGGPVTRLQNIEKLSSSVPTTSGGTGVDFEIEGCWLYISAPDMEEEIPTSWTRDRNGRVKTRVGTAKESQIRNWFKGKGVDLS